MATGIAESVEKVARQIIQEEIAKIEPRPQLYPMGLWALHIQAYQLKKVPIPIVVEEWPDDHFIAHWHDVGAIGFGNSQEMAIENLQEDIIALYEDLKETDDKELGKLPLKAKKILLTTLEEVKP